MQIPVAQTQWGFVRMAKTKSEAKAAVRQAQINWLDHVREQTGLDLTGIANRANVSVSTVTRFRNQKDYTGTLNAITIQRIAETTGVPAPTAAAGGATSAGMAEDAAPYAFDHNATDEAVRALIGDRKGVDAWRLHAHTISRLGYQPGDVLIVDQNATPRSGDAVCAQVFDWRSGSAETIFRLYLPPALVVATSLPMTDANAERVHIVDAERVVIRGVVTQMLRPMPQNFTSETGLRN